MLISKILYYDSDPYDLYNGINYAELNRRLRRDRNKSESNKIYNSPSPEVKKIYVKQGGEPESKYTIS